ncbi:hypothetical protein KJ910_03350 [Patescibacteria group bacterium]|nr:hypothetical protein [Patescibacteria group bacterium]MBU1906676.1 hypothetical protein [Patescibacteria group bacterium]
MSGYKDIHGKKKRKTPWTLIVIILGVIAFVLLFMWFRNGEDEPMTESDVLEDLIPVMVVAEPEEEEVVTNSPLEEIKLFAVSTTPASGTARRSIKDGVYQHSVKAQLPEPPPLILGQNDSEQQIEQFYEGWLVSRNPFTFFSTGEMTTNSDGEYVLEWTGQVGEAYSNYNEVVITIEPRDDDPAPADHILEGEF